MTNQKKKELARVREEYPIMKANALVQKSRYSLTLPEQRLVNYVCALIKPDEQGENGEPYQLEYTIDLKDYCRVCGLDMDGNHIYELLKEVFDTLHSKCIWIPTIDETIGPCEEQVCWFAKVKINKRSVKVRLDETLAPFLFQIKKDFTEFQLVDTLGMKSTYSMHLFEILKSYAFMGRVTLDLGELKHRLMVDEIPSYSTFPNFRRRVLEPAIKEINEQTCLTVSYDTIKEGQKVAELVFTIKKKDSLDRLKAHNQTILTMGEVGQPVKRGRGRPRKNPPPAAT